MKYLELFKNGFDSTIIEKIKPKNWPFVGYSPSEGLQLTDILKETPINYFYIESLDDNNVITLDSTTWAGYGDNKSKLEYSNDATSWTSMNEVDSVTINNGERLYMRCIDSNICKDMNSVSEEEYENIMSAPLFKTSSRCNIGGNINTVMFDYTYKIEDCVLPAYAFTGLFADIDVVDTSKLILLATELTEDCYSRMFYGCTSLVTTPELPATTLANNCYNGMFTSCTSLNKAPELPATELASGCYASMFANCTSLNKTPELPATELASSCYASMFYSCTSLVTTPELHATTLANSCYSHMFRDCTSLTTAPELPATELAEWCYCYMFYQCDSLTTPPNLPATTLANSCYSHMFHDCTSLVTTPELPATELANDCYANMFNGCTSLTTALALPATTLSDRCYMYMFYGCTSLTTAPMLPAITLHMYCYHNMFANCANLNHIECLAVHMSAAGCTFTWVDGVSSTGTFTKYPTMYIWPTGINGIPEGWTVVDAVL